MDMPKLPKSDQPSLDALILFLATQMLILGMTTVFFKPAYEAGFYAILATLSTTFTGACGARWGLSQSAKQPSVEHPKVADNPNSTESTS